MNDTIEVKLPSGKVAVVRNYTTRRDDAAAIELLAAEAVRDEDGKVRMPARNAVQYADSYVYSMTMSIGGSSDNISELIDNLRSKDYEVLKDAITKIVENNSPKVNEAAKASSNDIPPK